MAVIEESKVLPYFKTSNISETRVIWGNLGQFPTFFNNAGMYRLEPKT